MREILFKAKQIDNGEWIEGSLIDLDIDSGYCYIVQPYKKASILPIIFLITDRMKLVDPETLCQFTGLCDKNGKKIWENDIIKYHFGEIYAPIKYGYYQNCFDSQKTEHLGFYVDWTGDKCLRKDLGYWIDMVYAMPVGNIFDNKELLQER
jgi:uncharacterized phage protein (TIGR01671 family)|nr:MAG TPA: YopX protein [Caudoviricetes sp.]